MAATSSGVWSEMREIHAIVSGAGCSRMAAANVAFNPWRSWSAPIVKKRRRPSASSRWNSTHSAVLSKPLAFGGPSRITSPLSAPEPNCFT